MPQRERITLGPALRASRRRLRRAPPPANVYGRALADFEPLLPGEHRLVAACARGETAEFGQVRPGPYVVDFLQMPGDPAPEQVFAARLVGPDMASAERAAIEAFAGAHWTPATDAAEASVVWTAAIDVEHAFHFPAEFDATVSFFATSPASNERGWEGSPNATCLSARAVRQELAARRIRPGLLRLLALGGEECARVHELGVDLRGAWIDGNVDLDFCTSVAPITLRDCAIAGGITFSRAELKAVSLAGTSVRGLTGDGARLRGDLFLRRGFHSRGEVKLLGAKIEGNFEASGGRFVNAGDDALSLDRTEVAGSVFLDEGFHATGSVRLHGPKIAGSLNVDTGRFEHPQGRAITVVRGEVAGGLRFKDVAGITGRVVLTNTRVGVISDDLDSWPAGAVELDGFRYDRFAECPTDAPMRIAWLERQVPEHLGSAFRPHPWEQLIKVLREMGSPEAARAVAIAKQDKLAAAGKIPRPARWLHRLYGAVAGYGYKPQRVIFCALGLWALCSVVYWWGARNGAFAPTSIAALKADAYAACLWSRHETQRGCIVGTPEFRQFEPAIYSLELILPLVDLHQRKEWAPIVRRRSETRAAWGKLRVWWPGWLIRALMWIEILFGWVAGVVLVGIGSGLVKKD
jgi:hypothetical protein